MSTISRISPIAANDVSGQLKNTDDFDLALMALMVHAVKDELACLRNLHDDFLAVIKREEKNRRYYLKTKESRKRKRNENSNAELNPDGNNLFVIFVLFYLLYLVPLSLYAFKPNAQPFPHVLLYCTCVFCPVRSVCCH